MLNMLLPLIESLGQGGATTSLGRGSGLGSTLGKLLGGSGSGVKAFGDQQELGGAFTQISNLTSSISAAENAMKQSRDEHERLRLKAIDDEKNYGFRDPAEQQRMADMQRTQMETARQRQLDQQNMQDLQARAAMTMNPDLQAEQARSDVFRTAGALGIGGQIVKSAGPTMLRNLPGIGAATELAGFGMGQTNSKITGSMADTAAQGTSNVVGNAMQGASLGMAVGGPAGALAGAAIGGVASAAVEIAKLPGHIVDWSEALLDSQKTISRFSGSMARAEAQREVRGLMRDYQSAQTTGGATADLSANLEDLYDALRPLQDVMTVALAATLSALVGIVKDMVPVMKEMLDVMLEMLPGGDALRKAIEDKRSNDAHLARILQRGQLGQIQDAFRRLQAEDPHKPRQAARR